jgi:DNA-directed RNA polymerase specialized sigma subunit
MIDRNNLCVNYLPLASHVAGKYARSFDDFQELKGVAQLALVYASRGWNPDGRAQFTTYAYACMSHAILDHRRRQGRRIKTVNAKLEAVAPEDAPNQAIGKLRTHLACVV